MQHPKGVVGHQPAFITFSLFSLTQRITRNNVLVENETVACFERCYLNHKALLLIMHGYEYDHEQLALKVSVFGNHWYFSLPACPCLRLCLVGALNADLILVLCNRLEHNYA